jgi:hypothetical protein
MILLLMLPFLVGNFVQKWNFSQGVAGFGNTVVQIADADRDGNLEFYFTTYGSWPPYVYIYELHLPDTWQVDSIPLIGGDLLWGAGDFDNDGLFDLAMQFHIETPSLADGIMIYESPDSFSYPTQEVWRDTVGFALVTPICVYDIDQDSLPEIVKVLGDYTHLHVYESIGNNLYNTIAEITTSSTHNSSSTLAFGDFDSDNQNEFVWGYSAGEYSIWECTGNNSYQEILLQQLPTANIKDCFAVPDADGDGKPEFVVKGYAVLSAQIHAFFFEATADNNYEITKTFTLPGGDYYGGYSDVGDVDGDSIPEIALEGRQTVHIIKAAGDDSFYVWETLPGNNSGSSVRIFDIDGNGLSEVIISGNDQTIIYEYEVGVAENTPSEMWAMGLSVSPNPFRDQSIIKYSIQDSGSLVQNPTLRIYDVSGRLIKTFRLPPSSRNQESNMTWHGDDDTGRKLPGGVFFLKLQAGDYSATEKVLLIK